MTLSCIIAWIVYGIGVALPYIIFGVFGFAMLGFLISIGIEGWDNGRWGGVVRNYGAFTGIILLAFSLVGGFFLLLIGAEHAYEWAQRVISTCPEMNHG